MSAAKKKQVSVFQKIDKDQWGKRYSTTERTAVAGRWFKENGSKIPEDTVAERFMEKTMRRSAPKVSVKKQQRKSRPQTKTKSGSRSTAANAINKTEKDDSFLFAQDPIQSYVPNKMDNPISSLSTKKKKKPFKGETIEDIEKSDSLGKKFEDACLEYIKNKYADEDKTNVAYVFIPGEKILNEDSTRGVTPNGEEYMEAHIGFLLPRKKSGIQDLRMLNERGLSIRAQKNNTMKLNDNQPFGGSYQLQQIKPVKEIPGLKNMRVKVVHLSEEDSLYC